MKRIKCIINIKFTKKSIMWTLGMYIFNQLNLRINKPNTYYEEHGNDLLIYINILKIKDMVKILNIIIEDCSLLDVLIYFQTYNDKTHLLDLKPVLQIDKGNDIKITTKFNIIMGAMKYINNSK